MRSRAWSTLPCVAPSISSVSIERPSRTSMQDAHVPHGVGVGRSEGVAVDRGREEARRRRLSDAARPREEVRVREPVGRVGVRQGPHDLLLADDVRERARGATCGREGSSSRASLTEATVLKNAPLRRRPMRRAFSTHPARYSTWSVTWWIAKFSRTAVLDALQELVVRRCHRRGRCGRSWRARRTSGTRREGRGRP